MIDQQEIDRLNRCVAAWMGWNSQPEDWPMETQWWCDACGCMMYQVSKWSPATNPDHAGIARRRAVRWQLWRWPESCVCMIRDFRGECLLSETDGDGDKAEALATCRAIEAAGNQQGEQ